MYVGVVTLLFFGNKRQGPLFEDDFLPVAQLLLIAAVHLWVGFAIGRWRAVALSIWPATLAALFDLPEKYEFSDSMTVGVVLPTAAALLAAGVLARRGLDPPD